MRVDVIPNVSEARTDDLIQKTVIVIDVLRATSTIVTALEHGCAAVMPVETVNQAKQYQDTGDLLGGERFCKKIAGFHFGNSPSEYASSDIIGKRIVLTTTNGTRAIQKSQRAWRMLVGSMLNVEACAKAAFSLNRDIAILCAGAQDEFCLEDGLCAGMLLRYLRQFDEERLETNDLGAAMMLACDAMGDRLEETMLGCEGGKRLSKLGYRDDVTFCAQLNLYPIVPVWKDQLIVRF